MQILRWNCGHFWEQNHNSLRITAWIKNTSVHRTSISKLLKEQFHNPEWEGMIIGPLTETRTTWAGMVPSRNWFIIVWLGKRNCSGHNAGESGLISHGGESLMGFLELRQEPGDLHCSVVTKKHFSVSKM